jgi:hypothetical protein
LNDSASSAVSSVETTGTRTPKSPSATRSVASFSRRTGIAMDPASSTLRASVHATPIATTTASANAPTPDCSPFESPALTTPLITLIAGRVASMRQSSGALSCTADAEPSAPASPMSSSTGRRSSSLRKKISATA